MNEEDGAFIDAKAAELPPERHDLLEEDAGPPALSEYMRGQMRHLDALRDEGGWVPYSADG